MVVLDALDECGPTSQLKIIDMLKTLADQSCIQLLVTSRSNKESTKPKSLLDLSESVEHNELDIKGYIETGIWRLAVEREFSEDMRDVITQRILARSSEGFLWVQLVLQSISKARTARMVRDRLGHLPQDLSKIYSDSLSGTSGFRCEYAQDPLLCHDRRGTFACQRLVCIVSALTGLGSQEAAQVERHHRKSDNKF